MKKDKSKKTKTVEVREFANIRHDFTDKEMLEISSRQVAALQRASELDEQLKSICADFKAKIKGENALVGELTNKLSSGYEMRSVECAVKMDRLKGIKTYSIYSPGHKDHGKQVREDAMTQADYERLPLDDKPAAPATNPEKLPKGKKAKAAVAKEIKESLEKNQVDPDTKAKEDKAKAESALPPSDRA